MRVRGMTSIRSITECKICELHRLGVPIPEDYVLPQYVMPDPSMPPVPIESDDSLNAGILMLFPDAKLNAGDRIPAVGGVIGTVRSIFRAMGFAKAETESPASQVIVKSRPRTGLYGASSRTKK